MPRRNTVDHVHKYERVVWGKKGSAIYRCMIPNCPHFIQEMLAPNRISQCWGSCGSNVLITKDDVSFKRWHPMCDKCREERKERLEKLSQIGEESA